MGILQGHLYGRTRTVQIKSGMSIDSIRRAALWYKRLVRTVLGSMLTGISVFQWRSCTLAMGILQGHLYGRTRTVQVKSSMSIDSHPESCVLVQTASPYSPGKSVNWNFSLSCTLAI